MLAVFFVLLMLVPALPVNAASEEGANFSVKANIPDNQIDKQRGYFYLKVESGATQDLVVQVKNDSDEEIEVLVQANPGYTNGYGSVEYKPFADGMRDESMKYSFSDIATVKEETLVIPPKSSVESTTTLTIPKEPFDGMIIGGLVFTKKLPEIDEEAEGVGIRNQYQYVLGVVLENTGEMPQPELEMSAVYPNLYQGRATLIHQIHNTQPVIADELTMDISVYKAGETTPVLTHTKENLRIAPQSRMDYIYFLESYQLVAGDYVSKVHLKSGDKSWDLEQAFTIEADKAEEINKENVVKDETKQTPVWAIALIAAVAVVVLLLIIVVVLLMRKKAN